MPNLHEPSPEVCLIGVASNAGIPLSGCINGPAALLGKGLSALMASHGWSTRRWPTLQFNGTDNSLAKLLNHLADEVAACRNAGKRPGIVGGDHAMAAGTWRGVGRAQGRAPGLLWIDAHLDAHSPDTSPSGNPHGMPLASLFGIGHPDMVNVIGPELRPDRTVVVGARSWEYPEMERLSALGVRVYTMRELEQRGTATVLEEARRIVGQGPWGISLDIDAFDPSAAPGVSTRVKNGLSPEVFLPILRQFWQDPKCIALEIAEYNPDNDPDGRTAKLMLALLEVATA